MRAFIRTASFLLWPWQLTGFAPPLVSMKTFENMRFVSMRTEATCAMWIVSSSLPDPLGGVVHDAVRRDQDLGGKDAVPLAEAAGAEHVALGEAPPLPVDPEADERHDQQDGHAGRKQQLLGGHAAYCRR